MIQARSADASANDGSARPSASAEYHLHADCILSLDRFEGSPLLAQSRLCLIGLDAIVEGFAERWPGRRDQVYDMVERTLARRLDDDADLVRVSERDYLVAQPSRDRAAAQVLCLRSLKEILEHFLGRSSLDQLRLYEVSDVSRTGLSAACVDPRRVLLASPEGAAEEEPRSLITWVARESATETPSMTATLSDGVAVIIAPAVEPIFCLKTGRYIGRRIIRRVRTVRRGVPLADADLGGLPRCDLERIDLATIGLGLDQIEQAPPELVLMIPVSFANLASHRGAVALAAAMDRARGHVRQGLLCEVLDLDAAPIATLTESLAMVRRLCMLTLVRVGDPLRPQAGLLRQAGIDGVSLEAPGGPDTDAQFVDWARQTLPAARRIARSVMIYGVGSLRRMLIAAAHGASHAGVSEAMRRGIADSAGGKGVAD